MQREDEEHDRREIGELDEGMAHFLVSPRSLNIRIIRWVIRKPLTMLVIDAKSAIAPSKRIVGGKSEPVIKIEPTTEIAEIALVSDISGVCSSRDTRPITPRPM